MLVSDIPKTLFTCDQVKSLDRIAITEGAAPEGPIPGIVLMKRAGRAAFNVLINQWPDTDQIVMLCGGGNNAGDGYVLAALAAQKKLPVRILTLADPEKLKGDAATAYQYALQEGLAPESFSIDKLSSCVNGKTVIVDAMLGIGVTGEVRADYAEAINAANNTPCPVLAIDLPSGLCGDTGRIFGTAIKADATITFIGVKQGLLTARGPALTGLLYFDDLAVPAELIARIKPNVIRVSTADLKSELPEREADAHKGRFGHVLIVGGNAGMGGAAALAGEAAARTGAGLTGVATHPVHVPAILARCPEIMAIGVTSGQELIPVLERPTVIVLGPGLGRDYWSEQMLQQSAKADLPMVMDADALNLLAEGRVLPNARRDDWILTPHPGEAARLLGVTVADVQEDRFRAASEIQAKYGGVVVLKGAGTIIASARGIWLAAVGNPGMAVGGMGDVLSGVLGALLAQGLSAETAACLGVCLHGDAADLAANGSGQRGLLPTDLIPHIRKLINP